MRRLILFIGISVLMIGCAANPTQQAALLLIDQIDDYEEQIKSKIKAEQTFYNEIQETAKKAAGRQAWIDQRHVKRASIIELIDQAIVRDKGIQVTLLQAFLRKQNRFAANREQELAARRAELDENYRTSIDALAFKTQQLSIVRTQLLNLSQERDNRVLLIDTLKLATCLANLDTETESQEPGQPVGENSAEFQSNTSFGECK